MRYKHTARLSWVIYALMIVFIAAGCAGQPATAPTPAPSAAPETAAPPTAESTSTAAAATSTTAPVSADSNILYQDDFTNSASGWPEQKFDNYFIGYHEPEYYHVEIDSPNYKTTVFEPNKTSYSDAAIEVKVFTVSAKTSKTGDFSYGITFRRSGDLYYAFTISPRTKQWTVLKSSPTAQTILAQGTEASIHDLDTADMLHVDMQGSNFSFSINDHVVGEAKDADYAAGEVGFYAQTVDATNIHIHFDSIVIRKLDTAAPQASAPAVLYQDDFTNSASGWPEQKFDNYFIGYHEPEYYHVEIDSPNYKTTVFEPNKTNYGDAAIEVKVFTVSAKTSKTGDFSYGIAFRRSGDLYYAFTISPRTKQWTVLKNSPTAQTILAQGTEASIHDLDTADMLHVDMQGSNFSFSINDHVVGQAKDADYAAGEVGFYAQTVDATNIHIHFDSIVISQLDTSSQTQAPAPVMLYQDDFTNSASGWPEQKFDNYFIGYHEPEYYHVEIDSPNYKTTVFEPNKTNYGDAAIEVKVFTVSAKTSKTGDFSYGIAFRRSGDLYYAFTISPRTKQWTVLKNSPTAQTVLIQGTEASIHDLDTADVLRVEVQGPDFTFSINDHVVGEAKDADYAAGEVGFYAQTVDATNIHIHFDSIAVSEYTAPLACTVNALSLNVRTGPGTSFASAAVLSKGDMVTPIGRTEDGTWIKVMRENNPDPGWIYSDKKFVSCSSDVKLLPAADQ